MHASTALNIKNEGKMSKLKEFFNKVKSNAGLMNLLCVLSILIVVFTVVLLCIGYSDTVLGYIMYPLSALAFIFLVYCIVIFVPKLKNQIIKTMKKFKFTNELLESYGYRTVIFASCSFIINIAYAVVHAVIAIMSGSVWYGALAGYYISISLIRGILVANYRKRKRKHDEFGVERQIKSYRNSGVLLLFLNLALSAAIIQMIVSNQGFQYAGIMIYVNAIYAFCKLGLSIKNLVKVKKQEDYMVKAIKYISFADALVSILALQTALLHAFAQDYHPWIPNMITGAIVSSSIIAMGIYMIVKGQIALHRLKNQRTVLFVENKDNDELNNAPRNKK